MCHTKVIHRCGGGTTPGKEEVELRREQQPRAMPGRLYGCKRLKSSGTRFLAIAEASRSLGPQTVRTPQGGKLPLLLTPLNVGNRGPCTTSPPSREWR